MKILVTGSAGFIGFHLVKRLVARGDMVIGLDSINNYYDTNLKFGRLSACGITKKEAESKNLVESDELENYKFIKMDLTNSEALNRLFKEQSFDAVCNLAAQAGVRYSLENPRAYVDSNIIGFLNILEACRHYEVNNLSYASSSSVYGLNESLPFSTKDNVDHPISLYAASKKSNELMAHTYSHLFGLATTGLRFFTVYGPWGRPDMAPFLFTEAMLKGQPIRVFNHGKMKRDFTYVDDIVEGIIRVIDNPASGNNSWSRRSPDPSSSLAPYRIYNIGNGSPIALMDFIAAIEEKLGIIAEKTFLPMQPGDVSATWADTAAMEDELSYRSITPIREGVGKFIDWYKDYYNIDKK